LAKEKNNQDGMINAVTGLGTSRDKRMHNRFVFICHSRQELEDMYDSSDIATRIVDYPVSEMMREGFQIKIPGESNSISEDLIGQMEEMEAFYFLKDGLRNARLYGGAGTYVATDKSSDAMKPFDYNQKYNILFFYSYDRFELHVEDINIQFGNKNFMRPEFYRILPHQGLNSGSTQIGVDAHFSRFLIFDGENIARTHRISNDYWGLSSLTKAETSLMNFTSTHDSIATLMTDFSQGVFKLQGLTNLLKANQDRLIARKMEVIDEVRSIMNSVVLDSEDNFTRDTVSFGGVKDIIQKVEQRLTQSTNMPRVVLLGEGGSGLSNESDPQIKLWHQYVHGLQKERYQPALERLVKMYFNAQNGPTKGVEPENWKIEFNPLVKVSDSETAELRKKQAETDQIYLNTGVVTGDEIRESRFGGLTYDLETKVDLNNSADPLKDLEKLDPNFKKTLDSM